MEKSIPILWKEKDECCGCSACLAICPVHAIEMQTDKKGFLYPKIDATKCVRCGNCVKICSFKNDRKEYSIEETKIYAAKASEEIVKVSSSGGLFTVLSDCILNEAGAIISAIYNPFEHEVDFEIYFDEIMRNSARGSKYIQAEMNDIFVKGYEWIKKNPDKKLLFVGTGCQSAGFKAYVEKKGIRDKTIIIDVICHGAPSPGLWKKYAKYIENKNGGELSYITFKDKRNGWMNPSVYGVINGQEVSIEGYSNWFYGGYSIRESCYSCPYTKVNRSTDLTIGDFWGVKERFPDFFDSNGVSLILTHTKIGEDFFNRIKGKVSWREISKQDCQQPSVLYR